MRGLLVLLACLWTQGALAQGFALHDLTGVADEARAALGHEAVAQVSPQHLTVICPSCHGAPTVDLQLARLNDGTEQRVRSGKTSLGALEALCIKQNPDCRLTSLPAGPAVGWISVYALAQGAGATAVILRDGELLTVESRAATRGTAEDAVQRLAQTVVPRIVGR